MRRGDDSVASSEGERGGPTAQWRKMRGGSGTSSFFFPLGSLVFGGGACGRGRSWERGGPSGRTFPEWIRRSFRFERDGRWDRIRSLRAAIVVVGGEVMGSVSDGSEVVKRRTIVKAVGEEDGEDGEVSEVEGSGDGSEKEL